MSFSKVARLSRTVLRTESKVVRLSHTVLRTESGRIDNDAVSLDWSNLVDLAVKMGTWQFCGKQPNKNKKQKKNQNNSTYMVRHTELHWTVSGWGEIEFYGNLSLMNTRVV